MRCIRGQRSTLYVMEEKLKHNMKIICRVYPIGPHDCRKVDFSIESGGHLNASDTYEAGSLYLREQHVKTFLRLLERDFIETDFTYL